MPYGVYNSVLFLKHQTYITNRTDRNGKFRFLRLDVRGLTRNPKYSKL